jgi:host factor-I protein
LGPGHPRLVGPGGPGEGLAFVPVKCYDSYQSDSFLGPAITVEKDFMNRKLIRPNLSEIKEKISREKENEKRKMHPPTDTFAENYYYLKQMNKKTPMAVVFTDGETIEGSIEWYDRNCIKLNRDNAPNMLIFKSHIKYIYKIGESSEQAEPEEAEEKKPR